MRRTGRFAGEQLREWYRDQGYLECVRDILEHPAFQSMDQYIQHGGTTCLEHCLRVSYMSYLICRRKGLHFCEAASFTICFSMTGMFMEGRPENIFMASPIPGQLLRMLRNIFH